MPSIPKRYSQTKALLAITRASFKAIFSNPSAIIFSILFPIIFVMIFGAFGNGGGPSYRIAIAPGCDTSNLLFRAIRDNRQVRIVSYSDTLLRNKDLIKGNLTGIISVKDAINQYNGSNWVAKGLFLNCENSLSNPVLVELSKYLKLSFKLFNMFES